MREIDVLMANLYHWQDETVKTYKTNDPVKVCNELKELLRKIYESNKKG